jgi:hypothetical protein
MFNRLNQLVKENIKNEIFLNGGIQSDALESASQEASGVIVDVLKTQLDRGKAVDLMRFFKGKKVESDILLKMMINKFANRLNSYYCISVTSAKVIAENIIPKVMGIFVFQTNQSIKAENEIFALLNWLSGYTVNFENFFSRINGLQNA